MSEASLRPRLGVGEVHGNMVVVHSQAFPPAISGFAACQVCRSRRLGTLLFATAAAVIAATLFIGSQPASYRIKIKAMRFWPSATTFPVHTTDCRGCPDNGTERVTSVAPWAVEARVTDGEHPTIATAQFNLSSTMAVERAAVVPNSSNILAPVVFSAAGHGELQRSATNAAPATSLTSLAWRSKTYTTDRGSWVNTTAEAGVSTAAAAVRDMHTSSDPTQVIATTRHILYVRFIDPLAGLGNKMFQYASGVGLALRYGAEPSLVADHPAISPKLASMRSVFRMSPLPEQPSVPSPADVSTLTETGWGRYDSDRFDNRSYFERNTSVVGYLQSWRYFDPVKKHIRSEFALLPHVAVFADGFLRGSNDGRTGEDGNGSRLFIGVHVRRGDMVGRSDLYTVAPSDFLLKAMNHYVAKYASAHELTFVMATNDYEWVKNFVETRLPKHIRVLQLQFSPEKDMAVLSRCNHSIVTAGTFGWWSAWLAGGDVIYYKDFIRRESPLYDGHVPSDYYPPSWIGLD